MKKTTFLIVGKHAVLEALKNPSRKIERVFLTEDAQKKINRENQHLNLFKKAPVFFKSKKDQRIVLMTTKASVSYTKFKFNINDTILFGRESAGVPNEVHKKIKDRLKIPMKNNKRSLNIASSVAIILAESLKQTKLF